MRLADIGNSLVEITKVTKTVTKSNIGRLVRFKKRAWVHGGYDVGDTALIVHEYGLGNPEQARMDILDESGVVSKNWLSPSRYGSILEFVE